MTQPSPMMLDSTPRQLADLLGVAPDEERLWRPEELAAIYRHQMSAPLQVDLVTLEQGLAAKLKTLAAAQGILLKSFSDLIEHPNPPVELLILTKQFARACRISPHSPLPRDIAAVLYFVSIAAAMVRCRRRITKLADAKLREGFEWALAQSWLDQPTRNLFHQGLAILGGEK